MMSPDFPPPSPPPPPPDPATPGWYYPLILLLVCSSAMFSGLTLGLMSLDESQLLLIVAGDDPRARMHAERILPIRRRGNLLLCTLLLGNTLGNSMLAILMADVSWLSGVGGVVGSTAAYCSRHGLAVGAHASELVKLVILLLGIAAWPMSKLLDCVLGAELGVQYSRRELKQLFTMQEGAGRSSSGAGGGAGLHGANHAERARRRFSAGRREGGAQQSTVSQLSAGHGAIHTNELSWLCGALSLSERTADQIMTPMQHVFRIHEDDVLDFRLMRRIADSGHSRIPVMRAPATAPPAAELDAHAAELDAHAAPAAAPAQPSLGAGSDAEGGAEGGAKGGEEASDCGAGAAAGAWPSTARSDELVGLLRGQSHLAMVQRVNDADESRDPFYEIVGIVTLEDVLEELIGAEIVDESDVYTDNVTRALVEPRREEVRRRGAWQDMLDPTHLRVARLTDSEIEAVSLFLAASVPLLAALPPHHLHAMLRASSVLILEPEGPPLYERGEPCAGCTVVLQGRLSTRVACGSETFEGERGPWSILGAQALAQEVYVADFAVDVLEPTRVLQLARETYEVVCKAARQEAEATHSLARAAAPPSPSAAAATAWVDEAAAGRDAGQDAGQDAGGRSALTPSAGGPSLQPNPFFSGSSSSELARPPAGGIAIEMMGALPPASEDAAV
ncbi:hypothetical protein EMIHUDRAFT_461339 [Emiliania huxleyi CCMP1516]|uniref:CNNM transmembrane domain-containing protein n=2 Tax=Emiliania huxleyi TaxID=2903 RepID=A0A0D3J3P6_EMIH1|nr:hypothetical protein EMIHUDRAFT_461339 [Emiliania huxleyi CCMP1516]EOD18131.1 hypothetical protein EMIHUDRAFT_461339 [Emiliania huxleyi CCMP1516]|eukprot:XP_005770560.1 hypothetical protein EMIHUDRAFT_461339 [Emiliania huxleyi CCMP1516]